MKKARAVKDWRWKIGFSVAGVSVSMYAWHTQNQYAYIHNLCAISFLFFCFIYYCFLFFSIACVAQVPRNWFEIFQRHWTEYLMLNFSMNTDTSIIMCWIASVKNTLSQRRKKNISAYAEYYVLSPEPKASQSGKCYFWQHIFPSTTTLHSRNINFRNPTVTERKQNKTKKRAQMALLCFSWTPIFLVMKPNYRLQRIACTIEFATIKREETVNTAGFRRFSVHYMVCGVRLNKLFAFMPTECTMHLKSCNFICRCFCNHVMPIICFHFKCNFRLFPQTTLCRLSAWLWRTFYR